MGTPRKAHKHTRIVAGCRTCSAIQKKWYAKLRKEGFVDIEYGLENPRFTAQAVTAGTPDAEAKQEYYERIWRVFHAWKEAGRSARDCRIAELYAGQSGKTGTIRGIARTLRSEKLAPWSTSCVQATLKEIRKAAKDGIDNTSSDSVTYLEPRHTAA